jgi:predicted transcriptional regulator of viral defense system
MEDRQRLLEMAQSAGTLTAKEVAQAGIHSQQLSRLVREGRLERVGRGLYRVPGHPVSENHGLVLAARSVPRGVVCLLSALAFHGVGSQLPFEVWIAIDRRARAPTVDYPPLRVFRFSGASLAAGVETHQIEGQVVKVYSVPKTLADVFKYRNKVGLEVALEALREAWRERRFTMEEIDRYARICRVERVMRPYLEALVG